LVLVGFITTTDSPLDKPWQLFKYIALRFACIAAVTGKLFAIFFQVKN
jgi:hypothetical protein